MRILTLRLAIGCMAILGGLDGTAARGAESSSAARLERRFQEAQRAFSEQPTNIQAAVFAARTAFDWAELAQRDSQRADIAEFGMAAARKALAAEPTNAAAHYWLGMNYGQLARTKTLGALKLVRNMEDELLRAIALDPTVDFAGPHRTLGLLYRDAPGWPTSVGSKKKARQHLEAAVRLAPDFPENQLSLLETYVEWKETENLRRQWTTAQPHLETARKKFSGEEWEAEWRGWEKRLQKVEPR